MRGRKKAKVGRGAAADPPPTEKRRQRFPYQWSLHIPEAVHASSSSSAQTDRTVVRKLSWEESQDDHTPGAADQVHEDEAHDVEAVEAECEAGLLEEGAAKEGLLPDLRWPTPKVLTSVFEASRTLTHRCVAAIARSTDAAEETVPMDDVDLGSPEAMSVEADNLAIMQHVLGESYLPDSSAAATEAKAAALGLLAGVEEDSTTERLQRELLARHAADLPEVSFPPTPSIHPYAQPVILTLISCARACAPAVASGSYFRHDFSWWLGGGRAHQGSLRQSNRAFRSPPWWELERWAWGAQGVCMLVPEASVEGEETRRCSQR